MQSDNKYEEENDSLINNLFDESECADKITSHLQINKYKPTDKLTVARVYHLGRIISKIFQQYELPYWVTGKVFHFLFQLFRENCQVLFYHRYMVVETQVKMQFVQLKL